MKMRFSFFVVVLGVSGACLLGAGKKENEEKTSDGGYITTNQKLIVKDFSIENTQFAGDYAKKEGRMTSKGNRVAPMLTAKIVELLVDLGYQAEAYSSESNSEDAIIIMGEFLKMNTGSAALRLTLGFGAGKAKMEVRSWIQTAGDPSKQIRKAQFKATSGGRSVVGASSGFEGKITKALAKKIVSHLAGKKKQR